MNRLFSGRSDMPFALLLLAPSLLLLGGLVAWPMVSNIEISFLRLPLNPNIESTFVGVSNYVRILSDPGFWHSLWMTVWYTALVVAGSTVLGLAVAMFFNREFRLRKTARSLVILSYVTPSISLVFAWKYMFNNGYGIVNYLGVDLLHLYEQAPLWFDNPGSSFVLVVLFAIWRYFPYAFISFLAILQTIDKSLYEAAEMDGANAWQWFRIVTLPAIMPVLATVVTLRTIWMFYMFADFCLNPIGTDVGKEIKTLTGKQGADVIIETSGYADALQSAFRGLAYGGTISYVAFAKPFAEGFNLGREAHFNNAKIVFSRACSEPNPDYPRWSRKRIEETCWELLMNGYLNCEDLIDPVVTFANSPESYMQYVDQHPEQSIKMGVTF
ncbi:ABC transporter permease subunit [Escherichia coli]|nr:ABC transporter permease subunit [Escherichia coli]